MRSLLLPLLLLLLCALCAGRAETREDTGRLRLCGREMLRAVVFTCGGSRWRRLSADGNVELNGLSARRLGSVTDQRRRDLSQTLITICCQIGCGKSDLSALC